MLSFLTFWFDLTILDFGKTGRLDFNWSGFDGHSLSLKHVESLSVYLDAVRLIVWTIISLLREC